MVTYTLNKALPPIGHFDVLVVGGGPAGIGASIGAARRGASVGLIERSGQLGGMMTLGSVAIFMPVGSVNGIYAELIDVACKGYYLNKNPYLPHSQFNPIHMRYECMRKVVRAGVTVYLHSEFLSVLKDGSGKPSGVAVHTREGLGAVTCGLLIDCTGDARAAIDAGVGHTTGRPEDGATQPMTLMFEMQDTGRAVRPYMPEGAHSYGSVGELPQGRVLIFDRNDEGRVLVNMTRVRGNGSVNADVAHAELESMRQAFGVAAFLQSNGMPNHCVSSMAPQIGVRQTNQIEGDYTLTVADIVAGASFDDVAAQTDYEVDIHDPTGGTGNEEYGVRMYDIPYRCMLPRGLEGMLVAGRCVSADHTAMSSLRTIPTCMALGQAAGVAACVALESGRGLRDIDMGLFHGGLRAQGVEFVSH